MQPERRLQDSPAKAGCVMTQGFKTIFSPCRPGKPDLPNRIVSTTHGTFMPKDGLQTEQIALYQATRAAGGVG